MTPPIPAILLATLLHNPTLAPNSTLAPNPTLTQRLDPILQDPSNQGALIAVVVLSPTGEPLYQALPDIRLVPASNQKILTCAFALHTLGPDHQPVTRFWKVGDDIIVDAPGDPILTPQALAEVGRRLGANPRTQVFVRSPWGPLVGPGWEHDDLPFRYAPRIHGLTVNLAQFAVTNSGGVPVVPPWANVRVRHIPARSQNQTPSVTFDPARRQVTVAGPLNPESAVLARFALPDPARAAARVLAPQSLKPPRPIAKTPNRPPDATIPGPTIAEWIKRCLEPSDNLLAEHLLLYTAARTPLPTQNQPNPEITTPDKTTPDNPRDLGPNPYPPAQAALARYLAQTTQLPTWHARPEDGSGLSRHNLVTATLLARLVRHADQQPTGTVFREALPVTGEGTLRNRLRGLPVYAKTGTLNVVSALSGLAVGKDKTQVVYFSIVMNHYPFTAAQARQRQDRLVREILAWLDTH